MALQMTFSRQQQYTFWLSDYKSGLNVGHSQRRITQTLSEDTIGLPTAYD